jgi:ribulose-phosphate 3-epimerase
VVEILPSILAADFARLGDAIAPLEAAGCKMLHVDVMDGHFVPNISFGTPILESLRKVTKMILDVHLMISDADHYVPAFIDAGADQILVHQEACPHLSRTLHLIKSHGKMAGVVLNPATPIGTLEEVIDDVDYILLMSVNPGFGGQHFLPSTLAKIRKLTAIKKERGLQFPIEIDGGMDRTNVADVVDAGIEWIVAGSSVFHTVNPADSYRELLRRARGATAGRA